MRIELSRSKMMTSFSNLTTFTMLCMYLIFILLILNTVLCSESTSSVTFSRPYPLSFPTSSDLTSLVPLTNMANDIVHDFVLFFLSKNEEISAFDQFCVIQGLFLPEFNLISRISSSTTCFTCYNLINLSMQWNDRPQFTWIVSNLTESSIDLITIQHYYHLNETFSGLSLYVLVLLNYNQESHFQSLTNTSLVLSDLEILLDDDFIQPPSFITVDGNSRMCSDEFPHLITLASSTYTSFCVDKSGIVNKSSVWSDSTVQMFSVRYRSHTFQCNGDICLVVLLLDSELWFYTHYETQALILPLPVHNFLGIVPLSTNGCLLLFIVFDSTSFRKMSVELPSSMSAGNEVNWNFLNIRTLKEYLFNFVPFHLQWSTVVLWTHTVKDNTRGVYFFSPGIIINYSFFCYYRFTITNGNAKLIVATYSNEGSDPNKIMFVSFFLDGKKHQEYTLPGVGMRTELLVNGDSVHFRFGDEPSRVLNLPINLTLGTITLQEEIVYWYVQNSIPKGTKIGFVDFYC
ncbi:hypothetical protein RCL1_003911 [Eukaryota sp. TZLM3-RCL]